MNEFHDYKDYLDFRFNVLEKKIDEYRLFSDNQMKEHKDNHKWYVTEIVVICSIIMGLIKKFI